MVTIILITIDITMYLNGISIPNNLFNFVKLIILENLLLLSLRITKNLNLFCHVHSDDVQMICGNRMVG